MLISHHKSFNVVAFGELLWDLLPDKVIIGGAPFNFAYRINSLGHKAYIISSVGKDDFGEKALKMVRDLNMSTKYIQQHKRFLTGRVEVFLDEHRNPDYHIIPDVAYDHIRLNDSLITLVSEADCLCFGTLSQRDRDSRKTLEGLQASFKGRARLYDINLRKNCYTPEVIQLSLAHADILKMNDAEARAVNGLLGLNVTSLPRIGEAMIRQYPLQICIITLGPYGVLAFSADDDMVYEPGYKVRMEDPLGAGDAFSAGFISRILSGAGLRDACRFGNQMGAVVASQSGATQTITSTEMKDMIGKTHFNIHPELIDLISK